MARAKKAQQKGGVWLLVDKYVGNSNQARALARIMGWDHAEEKLLEYSNLALLPNFLQVGLSSLDKSTAALLRGVQEPPKIIVSAGRRAACVAVALKKLYPGVKLVQIMGPQCGFHNFSIIILPEHDRKAWVRYPSNVHFHHGAIVHFDPKNLANAADELRKRLQHKGPYITLLLGGSTKNTPFTIEQFRELWAHASACASTAGAMLLISSSRRTPPGVLAVLERELRTSQTPYYYYAYGSPEPNPYLGMLGLADYMMITADSISMCSECCLTGKPTYIYLPDAIKGSKHWRFAHGLIVSGQAGRLSNKLTPIAKIGGLTGDGLQKAVSKALID
ncbi:MAG: mitochondrial fission ELM1 family protein [Proteobacteria bacterium]|nr:mitochondrial fission ELM1 family protein [Pseudomonadota bacterium]